MNKTDSILKNCFISVSFVLIFLRMILSNFFNLPFVPSVILKAVASSLMVILAFLMLKKAPFLKGKFILAGMFFCLLADVVLEISFIPGGCIFAFAHLLFIIGFLKTKKIRPFQFIVLGILCAISIPFFIAISDYMKEILPLCIVYFLFIFLIISFSLSHEKTIICATICFGLSDVAIVINTFISRSFFCNMICCVFYYAALAFFAISCEANKN